jgi:hypothetical protein
VERATLANGRVIEFLPEVIGEGAMKRVHFTADRRSVVCFFKEAPDPGRRQRLEAVIGPLNPTLDPKLGEYWRRLFCWPTAIVEAPRLGLLAPAYPRNFYFASGPWRGKEKQGRWFSSAKLRAALPPAERGSLARMLQVSIRLARAVRRLHQAGLAHADLSPRNVLVDPTSGEAIVIDIDALVIPGVFRPDVIGTRGYIAPEVVATSHLPRESPLRFHPSARTDEHALAVLVYEALLFRHPLRGPKVHDAAASAEADEALALGERALFVEHPTDPSNRPVDLGLPGAALGPYLEPLFERAFVRGLHAPAERPAAIEWERALVKTWDLLLPCPSGEACAHGWMIARDLAAPRCPSCGARPEAAVPVLELASARGPASRVVVYDGLTLFAWHARDGLFPGENADRTPLAYFARRRGRWLLVNQRLEALAGPSGDPVPPGAAIELEHGMRVRLAAPPDGQIGEFSLA